VSRQQRVLVVGDTEIARRTCGALTRQGRGALHLPRPDDQQLQSALTDDVQAVALLVRGDVIALRYALLVEYLRPGIRLVVLLFDRTIADQLLTAVPNCQITSPADIAVPAIIGACLGDPVLAVDTASEPARVISGDADGARTRAWRPRHRVRHLAATLAGQIRPHDRTSRLLLTGLAGLAFTLLLEWLLAILALHSGPLTAFYIATRIVATVGPGETGHAPAWYLTASGVNMLLGVAYTALFTAGIVNRFLSARSIDIVGPRIRPSRDHIVVVGLGQVSLRLCTALRRLGIPVIAVERDPGAANLRLARSAGIPVLIAHAQDREVLGKLNLGRARALAAMGADDLDNVEVAIAALAIAPRLHVVLRAGDNAVISETRSLFSIGEVCDITALSVHAVVHGLDGHSPRFVYPHRGRLVADPPAPEASDAAEPAAAPAGSGDARLVSSSSARCGC
jgi:TrkA-N domain